MANTAYNPTFKRPTGIRPLRLRSPSPPRAFVEPLSPSRPAPIEPNFNYPAINHPADFTVRPEAAFDTTPRARAYSASQRDGHQRTPSTIDTLAEAALAVSPSRHGKTDANGYSHAHSVQNMSGTSEPPHKRSRSELLPSPFVAQYASRPATSYEPDHLWPHQPQQYKSRVEEAALLLNFQSGGWPASMAPPASAARPHANSFPQDAFRAPPAIVSVHSQPAPLSPVSPQDGHQLPPALPSPERTFPSAVPSAGIVDGNTNGDVEMKDAHVHSPPSVETVAEQMQPTQKPAEESMPPIPNNENTVDESATPPKGRRGWPKGKPRGSGPRKSLAEKAASKRAASRKKTPDAKSTRSKSEALSSDWADLQEVRRKSLSDVSVFGEYDHENNESQAVQRATSVPLDTPMLIREASLSKPARRKAAVKPETICAGCQTTRETTTSHGELDEWISCNGCKDWFHVDCAGFKKAHDVRDVDKFFCTACEAVHGKTTYVRKSTRAHAAVDYAELQRGVLKTSEESVEHHYIQPIKDGTFQFPPENFPRLRPEMVTREFFEKSGTFVEPICIPAEWNPRPWERSKGERVEPDTNEAVEGECDGTEMADLLVDDLEYDTVPDNGQDRLEMVMPHGLTVRHVCNLVGPDTPIDVIDVKTQNSGAKWTLSRWANYYDELSDYKPVRNVISLEVSHTKLGRLLQRPKVVRDIDLQDDVWPQEEIDKGKFPKVQFYCLMSVADSYTDFHIDFGGSSVYYHILKGKKTFFFIPPKPKHLKAYEEWNNNPQQNFTFLPSITKECYRVDLSEGDTMLIPSGWIHAVWTPEDSLVIGGNFLNRLSFKNQFKVVEIEKANETPIKFRYPHFQKVMWYTAIKYLKDDPLPPSVSQLFYEGKRFGREVPIWADFTGSIAADDPRPGAHNSRFYGQAEMDGLPDLVNFIFRTVMLVMGRIEGISQDRMKRVNASIPKSYGEPLEVAKTFALWVAWKRGNEDPPTWAHPDAILPNDKELGPLPKLSQRKIKELERKEAIEAWRVVPDRQSARVLSKTSTNVTPNHLDIDVDQLPPNPYYPEQAYEPSQISPDSAPPAAFMMSSLPGPHFSTPKTSVLGPKRVACDACRKRRIRCKHKDMVLQTSPNGGGQVDAGNGAFFTQTTPEAHENIIITPSKQNDQTNFMNQIMDGELEGGYVQGNDATFDAQVALNGESQINGFVGVGPQPGTNAYVNANIPMTMNGVAFFGEVPKRGRSKACYECRKSKRRCIHDDSGNVDPVKASETPVPRGSVAAKKRQTGDDGSPVQIKKKQRSSDASENYSQSHGQPQSQPHQHPQMQGHGVLKPQTISNGVIRQRTPRAPREQHWQQQQAQQEDEPPIDPSLFSMYPDPENNGGYDDSSFQYPYSSNEQAQAQQQAFNLPSLEQIANEVLHMNGHESVQQPEPHEQSQVDGIENGLEEAKPEDSVDSAVSLPTTEVLEQNIAESAPPNDTQESEAKPPVVIHHELPPAHRSIEPNGVPTQVDPTSPPTAAPMPPARPKSGASELPLYRPPIPLSKSPETAKRQPATPNGINGKSTSPITEFTPSKRKRDSKSATPAANKSAKKVKIESVEGQDGELTEVERQSIELAKKLQQEDLGLRRRSK